MNALDMAISNRRPPPAGVVHSDHKVQFTSWAFTSRIQQAEAIALLTMPPPDLTDLGRDLSRLYQWLADLDGDERTVIQGRPQDRSLVLRLLGELPGGRMLGAW